MSNRLPVCTLFSHLGARRGRRSWTQDGDAVGVLGRGDRRVSSVCVTEISGRASQGKHLKNETHFKSWKMIACAASRRTSSPYEQVRLSR